MVRGFCCLLFCAHSYALLIHDSEIYHGNPTHVSFTLYSMWDSELWSNRGSPIAKATSFQFLARHSPEVEFESSRKAEGSEDSNFYQLGMRKIKFDEDGLCFWESNVPRRRWSEACTIEHEGMDEVILSMLFGRKRIRSHNNRCWRVRTKDRCPVYAHLLFLHNNLFAFGLSSQIDKSLGRLRVSKKGEANHVI
jgi:hypothetical protein